jgi:radical SAM protein with 4Fe4S-binding SPASM domain
MTLEITTKIGCSNRCSYCPQDKLLNAYKGEIYMTTATFVKILENTPHDVQIDFAGFCEPFLNPWVSWMIRYASERYDVVLDTTLTGFTENEAILLKGVRLKQVYIHDFDGNAISHDIFDSKVELLKKTVITDKFEVGKLEVKHIWSRAGNLWETEKRKGKIKCGWTGHDFTRNVVLPNGDTYLCCMDYSLKHKLGNLKETHYNDLDREKIIKLCKEDDSELICRHCEISC